MFEGQLLVQKEWALGSELISQAWHQRALGVHIPACHLALGESLCPSSTQQLKTGGWSHLKSPSHISGAWHTHTHTHTHTRRAWAASQRGSWSHRQACPEPESQQGATLVLLLSASESLSVASAAFSVKVVTESPPRFQKGESRLPRLKGPRETVIPHSDLYRCPSDVQSLLYRDL